MAQLNLRVTGKLSNCCASLSTFLWEKIQHKFPENFCSTKPGKRTRSNFRSVPGVCPEDHFDVKGVSCEPDYSDCDLTQQPGPEEAPTRLTTTPHPTTQQPVTLIRDARDVSNSTLRPLNESNYEIEDNKALFETSPSPQVPDSWKRVNPSLATTRHATTQPRPRCKSVNNTCVKDSVLYKAHGPLTGYCIKSDR